MLVLFLCMWINCFNTIWHLFQHPAGFPFRNALFFTFFAVCTAYRSIQYKPWHFLTVSQKFWTLFIPLASFCIGFIWKNIFKFNSNQSFSKLFSQAGLPSMKIWMSFILSICFYTMSWFLLFKLPLSKNVKLLLIALTCTELMINFGLSMFGTPYGNQKNYVSNYQFKQKQITNLKHNSYFHHQGRTVVKDTSFQNAYNEKYNCYNDALLFRYFGISMYSSTLNKATRQDLEALGYLSVNPRRISFVGGTELTQSLLGVQNELDLNKNDAQLKINTTYF
ncbi:YfhO family protein, partial [Liquorilactobacillus uvarum]|uniref:YfhO family protein n=1 Tax=Liquorilactobacillus uvarum TaxID=303240 RepID=UPI00288A95FF